MRKRRSVTVRQNVFRRPVRLFRPVRRIINRRILARFKFLIAAVRFQALRKLLRRAAILDLPNDTLLFHFENADFADRPDAGSGKMR